MKPFIKALLCCCLSLAAATHVRASHLFGADFYYTHVSGNTYNIVLDVYGDCSGAAFPNLNAATPEVEVFDNGSLFSIFNLTLTGPPVEVTPVCPAQLNNTTCNGGSIPGVKKFTYSGTTILSGPSANWLFRFTGQFGGNNLSGRSNNITNIMFPGAGGSIMVLEATLNNMTAPNSSVTYTTIPTPFFCINQPTQYNPGAVDPNNDNLSFTLTDGLEPGQQVNYLAPFTAAQPLAVAPGSFLFNSATGQLGFNPNALQKSIVVYKVNEFRNGALVGTSMREMTFVVLNTCNNAAPTPGPVTGLANGMQTGPFQIQACKGAAGNLSFNFTAADANNDNITISFAGLPSGATATVANNNTASPQFNFSWNISGAGYGNYTFYVTLKDNGCPLASTQTYAYTISIAGFGPLPPSGALSGCDGMDNGLAWIKPANTISYTYTWKDAANQVIHQATSTNGDTVQTLAPGTYSVRIVNAIGCDTTMQITVPNANYAASFTGDSATCLQKNVQFMNTSTASFSGWDWDFGDGNTSQAKDPAHAYLMPGSFTVRLIGHTANGCHDTFSAPIKVNEIVLSVSPDTTICQKQGTMLSVSGANNYVWTPAAGLSCATCPSTLARPQTTTTYTVTGTDAIGCSGTAQVTITVLPTGLMVTPVDTSVCPGDSIQLHVSGATDFKWTPTEGLSDTGAHPWVQPKVSLKYVVTAWYANGCRDTQEVDIHFASNAVIYMPDEVTLYPGETYQMDPQGNCLYFHWWPPLGLSDVNIANPVAQPPVNTRYIVQGRTENGCKVTDSIDIIIQKESLIDIPNAFTPGNGNGNDVLKAVKRGLVTLKYLRIFNRWGNKVFETTDINEGWDGYYKGVLQPYGVYIYMIEAVTSTGVRFYKQGNITLIR